MSLLQDAKSTFEKWTGVGRPAKDEVKRLVRERKAHGYAFAAYDDTPNHPDYPLIHYRSPVILSERYDPAAIFEALFESHGWRECWRNGIYDFHHFHSMTHEVLGIARGEASVRFGGPRGRVLRVREGDVVILPAGISHARVTASRNLLVVGAYPPKGEYDEPRLGEIDVNAALAAIKKVPKPKQDPVYGRNGALLALWVK